MGSSQFNISYIKNNISVVLQGSLCRDNIDTVCFHCEHWRKILPEAEIILSISTTDFLSFMEIDEKNYLKKELINFPYSSSIESLNKNCDYIIYDQKSSIKSLPPIKKNTTSLNHINFMIESSVNGLSVVTNDFCLRIRNDAIFQNTNFISLYCSQYNIPRKSESSVFSQRVLVPWIYTLNPFSDERIPLHISDWLNFGLTADVKKIWNIPLYTLEDALFYANSENKNMNSYEKLFNVRLAVEQHIYYNTFKKFFPNLKISYLNDMSSVDICLDITIDNFIIFSNKEFSFVIKKKYQKEFYSYYKRSSCISGDAWKFMSLHRNIKYKRILKGNVDRNIKKLSHNTFSIEESEKNHSPIHQSNKITKKIIYLIFNTILKKNMKIKFLQRPEEFFSDSKSNITKNLASHYLSR